MATSKDSSIAESIAQWATTLNIEDIPPDVQKVAQRLLLDISGLCIAARQTDYVAATISSCDEAGNCTVIGHANQVDPFAAALINGTAAHGEDFDDTFEGTPVHVGAVLIPTLFALAERYHLTNADVLRALAAGAELSCRMALVTPMAIHRAGFHPTAVIGTMAAALAAGVALRLPASALVSALGLAGSMASGIIEYLAEGTWSKRLHAGWAAQSGIRAALLGRAGFIGPRTVFEGRHGFFHSFTNADIEPDFSHLQISLDEHWLCSQLAFKPYPCGTMMQPFIDCALMLQRQGIDPRRITSIECKVGEGTVHRLWEPLTEKHNPSSSYSAKFSVPYGIAVALLDGAAGLEQFSASRVAQQDVRTLAARIGYRIDPDNEYPRNYSGHLQVTLNTGEILEFNQPHLRGGAKEPLTDTELTEKFRTNLNYGSWPADRIEHCQQQLQAMFNHSLPEISDLSFLRAAASESQPPL